MTQKSHTLQSLVTLSRALGDPRSDYVVLGEGNTSAAIDRQTFWVKASGVPLNGIHPRDFIEVPRAGLLAVVAGRRRTTQRATVAGQARPSIEALFHAVVLELPGISFVGHTHPTSVNRILCSRRSRALYHGAIFPDAIVYCGRAPVYVPYMDPGVPLARAIQRRVDAYVTRYRESPRLILLENHGMIALGHTPQTVLQVTAMAVKTAAILWGASVLSTPRRLTRAQAAMIATRPDERYRQQLPLSRK